MRRAVPHAAGASWLSLAVLLAGCAPADNDRCVMREVAEMTVLNDRGPPVVRVGIDGQPAAFVVDTGASMSSLTPEATARFGVPVDRTRSAAIRGVGGDVFVSPAAVERLDLGTAAARNVTLLEAGSFGHRTVDGLPLSGLFGADFLAAYDVEFDLPAHHVSLYDEAACNAEFPAPWDGIAYRQPFDLEGGRQIMLDARLDRTRLRLQLDSGAAGTIVDTGTAAAAGATAAELQRDRMVTLRGVDGRALPTRVHRFGALAIGPDTLNLPLVGIADIRSNNLLGANFLRTHRVWVSYGHEVLWVQPVGRVRLLEPANVGHVPS